MLNTMNNHSMEQTWFSTRPQPTISNRDDIDFTIEGNRFESFANKWSHDTSLSPLELAAAGLYFTGPGDRVQCAWCKGGLYNWEAGDIAIDEHKKHFPECLFIQRRIDDKFGICNESDKVCIDDGPRKINSWKTSPAVTIVGQMGYDEEIITKAVHRVLSHWCKDLTASELLDAIYEIEAAEENPEELPAEGSGATNICCEAEKLSDGIQNYVHIGNDDHHETIKKSSSQISDTRQGEVTDELTQSNESVNTEHHYDESLSMPSELSQTGNCLDQIVNGNSQNEREKCSGSSMHKQNTATTLRLVEDDQEIKIQPTTNTEIVALLEENKKLKHSKTCKICLENEVNVLFLPCRHLVCCDLCGDSVKMCPLCRTVIVATVKTYLA